MPEQQHAPRGGACCYIGSQLINTLIINPHSATFATRHHKTEGSTQLHRKPQW